MTNEQRLQAEEKQAALDRAKAEQRAAEARAREAEAAARFAELERRRRSARYGERVQCVLSEAHVSLGGKWYAIEPVPLDLVRGLKIGFEVIERKERNPYRDSSNYAFFTGQTVSICPEGDSTGSSQACLRMVGTTSDYEKGTVHFLESPRFLKGTLRCELFGVLRSR
jgi:hypothetical protein